MIVDDGGDATLLIHKGFEAELEFEKNGTLPDPTSTEDPELFQVLTIIRANLQKV